MIASYTIESLIAYIQDKGYTVRVYPQVLVIRKYAPDGMLYGVSWGISHCEFKSYAPQLILEHQADRHMAEIEKAIAERREAQI